MALTEAHLQDTVTGFLFTVNPFSLCVAQYRHLLEEVTESSYIHMTVHMHTHMHTVQIQRVNLRKCSSELNIECIH